MTPGATPVLEVTELSLRFGAVSALQELSFQVSEAELFAVIGPNGAGKTSLFNLLSRTYQPTSGRISYFGSNLLGLRAHQLAGAGIARTFQNIGLFQPLTALDNVLVGRTSLMRAGVTSAGLRLPRSRREEREHRAAALEALRLVEAHEVAHTPVRLLPYGVQKRVEIARALAMEPKLLLLDEPVAGMSREERRGIAELVSRLNRERQLTIVLVEHDMGVVMGLAHRILVLDFGRLVALGAPAQIQANPEVIRAYLGEPTEASA
jgi:branched-chain amino acid transport system ATP-binding protein